MYVKAGRKHHKCKKNEKESKKSGKIEKTNKVLDENEDHHHGREQTGTREDEKGKLPSDVKAPTPHASLSPTLQEIESFVP